MPGPVLRSLVIADDAAAWSEAGFAIDRQSGQAGVAHVGGVEIRLLGRSPDHAERRGIEAWAFDDVDDGSIDGITTLSSASSTTEPDPAARRSNPNGAIHLDHVVMATPDLDRSIQALRLNGFEPRRVRDVPGIDPPRKQVFFWAGETIIELLGPATPTGTGPATLWGLAITADDLDLTADRLGPVLSRPKKAVQRGRRIATLRTKDLDISTAIAFMTPHSNQNHED